MNELLALPERPTAVFVAGDEMAIGAIEAIHEAGYGFRKTSQSLGTMISTWRSTSHRN